MIQQGVVLLPKGTILYLSRLTLNTIEQNVLFLTFHPSEKWCEDSTISKIELQRIVVLVFYIERVYKMRIFSSHPKYIQSEFTSKHDPNVLNDLLKTFSEFDGWLTSIDNHDTLEVVLRNDPTLFRLIECKPLQLDWRNSTFVNTNENQWKAVPKKWGKNYPISSNLIFILPKQFEQMIQTYMKQIEEEDPNGTVFSILMKHSTLLYLY